MTMMAWRSSSRSFAPSCLRNLPTHPARPIFFTTFFHSSSLGRFYGHPLPHTSFARFVRTYDISLGAVVSFLCPTTANALLNIAHVGQITISSSRNVDHLLKATRDVQLYRPNGAYRNHPSRSMFEVVPNSELCIASFVDSCASPNRFSRCGSYASFHEKSTIQCLLVCCCSCCSPSFPSPQPSASERDSDKADG
jgi:hypothetical protein